MFIFIFCQQMVGIGGCIDCDDWCILTYGIMHNYATESAKKRLDYSGKFYDFTHRDADAIPDWLAQVNFLLSIITLGFLVYGIYVSFFT